MSGNEIDDGWVQHKVLVLDLLKELEDQQGQAESRLQALRV